MRSLVPETPDLEQLGWRRVAYPLIDAASFVVIWNVVMSMTNVRVPFAIMQQFSRADYDAYVRVMTWMTLGVFALSIDMHAMFGGSLGKFLVGVRTVQIDGTRMTLRQVVLRACAMFLLGLAILAPGPLIAFVFGRGSEPGSFFALWAGGMLLWLTTFSYNRESSPLERALGLKSVLR